MGQEVPVSNANKVIEIQGDKYTILPKRHYELMALTAVGGLPVAEYQFLFQAPAGNLIWMSSFRGGNLVPRAAKLRIKKVYMSLIANNNLVPADYISLYEAAGTLTITTDQDQKILECQTDALSPEFNRINNVAWVPNLAFMAPGGYQLADPMDGTTGAWIGGQQNLSVVYNRHIAIAGFTAACHLGIFLDCELAVPVVKVA